MKSKIICFFPKLTLGGQTVHWIGAQFCVCMFLDSSDKYLNMLNFCRNDQRKVKNERRTKGASLMRNPLTMHKMHSLASLWSCKKNHTVLPNSCQVLHANGCFHDT